MKINENIFKMFEEWKDSEDYLIQSWFKKTFDEVNKWFENNQLDGFIFNDANWSSNDNYLIYTGIIEFSEETIDYKLEFVIEYDKISDGIPTEFSLILTGYTLEDSILLGKLNKNLETTNFAIDFLINLISEFKDLYKNE